MHVDSSTIRTELGKFERGDVRDGATEVLRALGYTSERTLKTSGDPAEFFGRAPSTTRSRARILRDAKRIHMLFQYTDEEVRAAGEQAQLDISGPSGFDAGQQDGFLFTVVELRKHSSRSHARPGSYSRGDYAQMTREINRAFAGVPAVVLFRAQGFLTIGFVGRRPHKRDSSRDVLKRASLIKDIDLRAPHRAHVETLAELSVPRMLEWMDRRRLTQDFHGLHTAWLAKLDTEELNRRFYRDLFAWFEFAVREAKFPNDDRGNAQPEEHVIRLITRLMFVWFMKENLSGS